MTHIKADEILNATNLACPMPIVKTKKAITNLEEGKVLEIQATDKGSTAYLKAWSNSAGHQYLGTIEEGDILKHYVRKASSQTIEAKHEAIISNEQLQTILAAEKNTMLLDVREEAEYAFEHIPGAKCIPLGELEGRLDELQKEEDIYVICRTASRSDLASQLLVKNGFNKVYNVAPGMSEWKGETETINS